MPADTEQMINDTFGSPQYPGEKLIRGIVRNIPGIVGGAETANFLNPLRYTDKSIAKSVLKAREKNKNLYEKKYDDLFKKSDKNDLGSDLSNVSSQIDFDNILINEPKKSATRIKEFIQNPNTKTAHYAKSDLLKMQRKLINKHETQGLIGSEPSQLDAISNAIEKIEENMFSKVGIKNINLADKYRKIQSGYDKDVLTYARNKAINAYRKGDLTKKELVQSLRKGKFAARKGKEHPELFRGQNIKRALIGLLGGGIGLESAGALKDYLTNRNE
jgi:hypothetical protein